MDAAIQRNLRGIEVQVSLDEEAYAGTGVHAFVQILGSPVWFARTPEQYAAGRAVPRERKGVDAMPTSQRRLTWPDRQPLNAPQRFEFFQGGAANRALAAGQYPLPQPAGDELPTHQLEKHQPRSRFCTIGLLSVEEQFYMLYPIVLFLLRKHVRRIAAHHILDIRPALTSLRSALFYSINSSWAFYLSLPPAAGSFAGCIRNSSCWIDHPAFRQNP